MKTVNFPKQIHKETIEILEEWLQQAKNGEFKSVSLIAQRTDKTWQTGGTSSKDQVSEVAMLMELAIRRLGFAKREE
jgi:hypothetical protein